jgi:hypothetical protein
MYIADSTKTMTSWHCNALADVMYIADSTKTMTPWHCNALADVMYIADSTKTMTSWHCNAPTHTERSKSNNPCCALLAAGAHNICMIRGLHWYDAHRTQILRVAFAWHMRQIHAECASHPRIRRKCCAHLPRATRDVTFGPLCNIGTLPGQSRKNNIEEELINAVVEDHLKHRRQLTWDRSSSNTTTGNNQIKHVERDWLILIWPLWT